MWIQIKQELLVWMITPPLSRRLRLNWDSWEVALISKCNWDASQKKKKKKRERRKSASEFLRWQIIIFSRVHHTLLNVMVFMILFSLQSFASLCSVFESDCYLFLCTLTLCCHLPKIGKFILYFLFFISTFFVPALPYSWDWGHQL